MTQFMSSIIENDIRNILLHLGNDIHKLEGKRILITGGAGMLANYIVQVINYANDNIFKNKCTLFLVYRSKSKKYKNSDYIRYLNLNIAEKIPKIDHLHYIVHAASKAAPKFYTENKIDTLSTNIKGTFNVLSLVDKSTESILYFSSGEVYGQPLTNEPIPETYIGSIDHLGQRSCYVEGKKAAETILMNYFYEKKYPIKIARILHTFGPGLNLMDGRVFSDFISNGLIKKNIAIKGNKDLKRPLLYIKDATIMLFKILFSSKNGEIYNVSNQRNLVSVKKMAEIVRNVFNNRYGRTILSVEINDNDSKYYKGAVKQISLDISKFTKIFKFEPNTGVQESFERTIDFYLDEGNAKI